MTIKPHRSAIRKASEPGPKERPKQPGPEQPILPTGAPVESPPTYEALTRFKISAEEKMEMYRDMIVRVYRQLGEVKGADDDDRRAIEKIREDMLHFDRRAPKIDDPY